MRDVLLVDCRSNAALAKNSRQRRPFLVKGGECTTGEQRFTARRLPQQKPANFATFLSSLCVRVGREGFVGALCIAISDNQFSDGWVMASPSRRDDSSLPPRVQDGPFHFEVTKRRRALRVDRRVTSGGRN